MRAWGHLHAVPGTCLYGREHARTILAGLRKIFCPYWNPISQSSLSEDHSGGIGSNPDSTDHRARRCCHPLSNSCLLERLTSRPTSSADSNSKHAIRPCQGIFPAYNSCRQLNCRCTLANILSGAASDGSFPIRNKTLRSGMEVPVRMRFACFIVSRRNLCPDGGT